MSLSRKFLVSILVFALVVGGLAAYGYYRSEVADTERTLESLGEVTAAALIGSLHRLMASGRMEDVHDLLRSLETQEPVSGIQLIDRTGAVKASSDRSREGLRLRRTDAGCRECHDRGTDRKGILLPERDLFRWAEPIPNKPACHACHGKTAKNNGVLIVDFSIRPLRQHVRTTVWVGISIFAAALLSFVAVFLWLTRTLVVRRLTSMGEAMRAYRRGDLDSRFAASGSDEIADLGAGFNDLADAVGDREREKDEILNRLRIANESLQREMAERSRADSALRGQMQFLQILIDTIPVPIFYKDRDGVYLGCNRAFLDYLKLTPERIIGKTVYDIAPKDLADTYHRMDAALFEQGGVQIYEFGVKHVDGTQHAVMFHKATFADGEGRVAGLIGVMLDVEERKRSEDALRRSNEVLQALIQASPLAIMAFDARGTVHIWNPAAERIFGWSPAEAIGRFNPIVTEDKIPEFRSLLERILAGETIANVELRRQRKDGTFIDVSVSSAPVTHLGVGGGGIMSVIEDITERNKAQQQLRRSYDTQTAINWILDVSLKEVSLDGVLKEALDLVLSIPWLTFEPRGGIYLVEGAPEQLVLKAHRGLDDRQLERCSVVPSGACLCGKAAARGEVLFADSIDERHEIRYEGIAPHGHYCVPIKSGKRVVGVMNIYLEAGHRRDDREIEFLVAFASALAGIIGRKRIEQEREKLIADLRTALESVSRSQKEWQDTFDSITDEIAIIDREFVIIRANQAFAARRGLHPREVVGRTCFDVVHGAGRGEGCLHERMVRENRLLSEEVLDSASNRISLVSVFPYRSPEGETIGSIHVARDITEQREAETRLIMSERLASLGQMASGIAHEINNPLASIAGCSEGILTRLEKGECERPLFEKYLKIIQEEVFRCKSITTAMLSFVRKTTYEKKDVDINGLLDRTLDIIGFQGRLKELEIRKDYADGLPLVHGNEGELRQVFIALVTNALDAMDNRGTLTLKTGVEHNRVTVVLSDTGPGIPPEALQKIFDPFFTMKADKGGTGLGLSIARKIILNHNGVIEVSSPPGQGATFTITLPA